jgi:hypothetical protein
VTREIVGFSPTSEIDGEEAQYIGGCSPHSSSLSFGLSYTKDFDVVGSSGPRLDRVPTREYSGLGIPLHTLISDIIAKGRKNQGKHPLPSLPTQVDK